MRSLAVDRDGALLVAGDGGDDRTWAVGDADLPDAPVGPLPFVLGLVLGAVVPAALWWRSRATRVDSPSS